MGTKELFKIHPATPATPSDLDLPPFHYRHPHHPLLSSVGVLVPIISESSRILFILGSQVVGNLILVLELLVELLQHHLLPKVFSFQINQASVLAQIIHKGEKYVSLNAVEIEVAGKPVGSGNQH